MDHEYNLLFSFKVEKQWQKRVQQWQLEREARRKMTEEMVVIRKQQIAEKCKLKLRQTQKFDIQFGPTYLTLLRCPKITLDPPNRESRPQGAHFEVISVLQGRHYFPMSEDHDQPTALATIWR